MSSTSRTRVYLVAAVLLLLLAPSTLHGQQAQTLRVAMYPYVPAARELFYELEAAFEAAHPGVNLELVETFRNAQGEVGSLTDEYYSGGLLLTEADIYEIDTVLLPEMIEAGKITPVAPPQQNYLPFARQAVEYQGRTWAVPHWVCGNFLFFEEGDTALARAATWRELMAVLADEPATLMDLKGSSTLGEWYLTALALRTRDTNALASAVMRPDLDPIAHKNLSDLLAGCPAGYCRSASYHDRTGFYARKFARGDARAYIGYSETLSHALDEISGDCEATSGCRTPGEIAVRALPVEPGGAQVGWVDAFGIASGLDGRKRQLAEEFLRFVVSTDAYARILNPEWPSAPRYLLPAVQFSEQDSPLKPAFYPDFFRAFGERITVTQPGLNDALRRQGKALNCKLPLDRGDTSCSP